MEDPTAPASPPGNAPSESSEGTGSAAAATLLAELDGAALSVRRRSSSRGERPRAPLPSPPPSITRSISTAEAEMSSIVSMLDPAIKDDILLEAAKTHADVAEALRADRPHIYRIVLTGGPCGGKTTALARLRDFLVARSFRVFTVPEAATLFWTNGAAASDLSSEEAEAAFQTNILRMQIHLEDTFSRLAAMTNSPAVVLCDRGAMDGKAYIDDHVWSKVMEKGQHDVVTLRDQRYNAVFHLVSAANGAEKYYSTETNSTRYEPIERARELDEKLKNAWVGHPKLRVFDNSTSFEIKLQRVVDEMAKTVGIPTQRKILHRRFKLHEMPRDSVFARNGIRFEAFSVEKVYLLQDREKAAAGEYSFIRRREQAGWSSYHMTVSSVDADGNRIERKRIISAREYALARSQRPDPDRYIIRQRRVCFLYHNQYFEINTYTDFDDLSLLNMQISEDETEISYPPWIDVEKAEDVTNDYRYNAYWMSLRDKSMFSVGQDGQS